MVVRARVVMAGPPRCLVLKPAPPPSPFHFLAFNPPLLLPFLCNLIDSASDSSVWETWSKKSSTNGPVLSVV